MTNTTVAAPTRHTLKSSTRTIQDFLQIDDRAYQMGSAARTLLERLAHHEAVLGSRPAEEGFVCLAQGELALWPGEPLCEGDILERLKARNATPCTLGFVLDLWAAPNGALTGSTLMVPLHEYRLEIYEEAGVRWLRAVSAAPRRQWRLDTEVIYMAP